VDRPPRASPIRGLDHPENTGAPNDLPFRSGFIAVLGRPNVGKSTFVNRIVGEKVSITAKSPNTTRTQLRGVLHGPGFQAIFVDTPGIHKPRTPLGERLNEAALSALGDVDICILIIDASKPIGVLERSIARRLPRESVIVLNKIDRLNRTGLLQQLARSADELTVKDAEYFPVSARTGEGMTELVSYLTSRLTEGPRFYEEDMVRDTPEPFYVAELVREQLLIRAREELPHAIACRITEWDWPYIACEILVERESQKAIVVGRGGSVLKDAGIAVRQHLPPGTYLSLQVRVEPNWQKRTDVIERLGY
jgi:GTP-binding protein Era